MPVHRKVDVCASRQTTVLLARGGFGCGLDSIAGLAAQPVCGSFFQRDEEIIHRVAKCQEAQIGLKLQPQFSGWRVKDFVSGNRWL